MARQRAAYGSISPTKNGITRVRYWGDLHDGKGYRRLSKNIRGNRRDAQEFLARMQLEHNQDKPTLTISDVYRMWYVPSLKQKQLAPSTINIYAGAWKTHIEPRWGNVQVNAIKPMEVQEWLYSKGKNPAQLCLKILKAIQDHAVRYEIADTNPFAISYIMPKNQKERDKGIYTLDECKAIAKALEGHMLEAAYILAAFGSCRTGEALGVYASDVKMVQADNGMRCAVVEIKRQVTEQGQVTDRLKTKQSERMVVIPAPYSERIEAIAKSHKRLLTCDNLGHALKRFAVRDAWTNKLYVAGIDLHPFQNLRNSWRTYMEWELQASPAKLEKLMGHKGNSVTSKHYTRPEIMQLVNTVADAFMG